MSQTPLQTIINPSSDPSLNVYATSAQNVPVITSANVVITNTNQYITEIYNLKAAASGSAGELQFNDGTGLAADTGLSYDAASDSLHVSGNVFTGNLRTDHLLYANGTSYTFSGSSYGNGNVASYLPTYNGTVTGGTFVSSGHSNAATFNGSGAGLSNLPAANVVGNVSNATFATTAGTANSVAGTNVSGTVANATHATTAGTANSVAGANVSGAVASANNATTATTVTANAQPNITSVGTLTSLSVTANLSAGNLTITGNANVSRFTASSLVNLGAIGNLTITGGTNGQTLTTDGAGHLSWATGASASTPSLQDVSIVGNETDQPMVITNTTASTSYATGALKVSGGIGVAGELHVAGNVAAVSTVYAGLYADYSSYTFPKFVARDAGNTYVQAATVNISDTGSADWVAYGDQSSDEHGWMDMGYTGSSFNDTTYTITKESDGYIICQGLPDQGGNLVIATGDVGGSGHRDIVFGTGGFAIENEKMRLNHEDSTLYVGAHGEDGGTNVVNLDTNGNLIVGGNFTVTGNILPSGNVAKDIGSATHRFRDLYLSGTTIHLGGISISVDANTGNISMGNLVISGSGNVTGDSVTGQVANALQAGTVYSNAQPNITSVGPLAGLSSGGNITFQSDCYFDVLGRANFSVGNLYINGGTTGQVLTTNGSGNLSWTTVSGGGSSYGDSNVLSLLDTYVAGNINFGSGTQVNFNGGASFDRVYVSGNITTGNISGTSGSFTNVSGNGSALHHLAGANVTGQVANALQAGTVYTGAQPNITSVGTLVNTTIGAANSITGGNLVSATYLSGTVTTAIQSNITSVGTLNGLSAIGSVNLGSAANVTITGAGANGQVLTSDTNGHLSWSSLLVDIPVTNRYYVDATRPDSYSANGSQAKPFSTIAAAQAAIASSGINPQSTPVYITLLSNITEDVTLSTGRVYLVGQSGSIHQPIVISGTITVEATSGTLGTNHFSLIGIEVVGPTNGKAIWIKGTYPTRLNVQDIWITANGNSGVGLYQDNTGTGTYTHGGPVKVSHNGTGDVYCFQIMKGTASFSQVETSGATQVGSVGPGAVLTFNDSELDASGDVVVETYGSGTLVVTNSVITNTGGNTCHGIKMNAIANVAGTVSLGQTAVNIPVGSGQAIWLDPNTTLDYAHGGILAYTGVAFYPSSNKNISSGIIMSPLDTIAGNTTQTRAVPLVALGSQAFGLAPVGTRGFITDGNLVASGNFGAIVAGGGSNAVPVYSDGTDWRIG